MAKTAVTLDQAFLKIEEELFTMFLRKHKDYGKGNILANKELGIAMRVNEKIERIKHLLAQNNTPANETLDETWTDIAVYAIIAKLLRNGSFVKLNVDQTLLDTI